MAAGDEAGVTVRTVMDMDAVPTLEFWPDYGPGPLWQGGQAIDLEAFGIPDALAQRLRKFNAAYEEHKIPSEGAGDPAFLAEGRALLGEVRVALAGRFRVSVTEVLCAALLSVNGGRSTCPPQPGPMQSALVGGGCGAVLGLVAGVLYHRRQ